MEGQYISNHIFDSVNEQLFGAIEKAQVLKAEAERAAHAQAVWEKLLQYLNQEWHLHILKLLKDEAPVFNELSDTGNSILPILAEIKNNSQSYAENLIRRFPSLIEQACAKAGLSLDRDSRHPKYKFYSGFFQLEVDDRNRIAKLLDNEGVLAEFPSDIGAITEAIQREYKRIFERPFDGKRFLEKLRHQYLEIVKHQKKKDGESIPIRNITRRLGKNEKGFRTDEFLIDLSRLVEQGPAEIDGFRFDLQQTKDTRQGMLLHGAGGRGYIGFITFRKS